MKLTRTELMELRRQASARNGRADSARHARLILLLSEGLTWAEIRAKLDCSDSYIDRWSKRFAADRLAGLFARHAGRERYKVTERIEARALAWTTKRKPADGSTHWSSRKLAAELGGAISHMSVARIWAQHGIKPHRLEGYLASNQPDFESKAADVCQGQPKSPQLCQMNSPHPVQDSVASSARTSPALSFSLSQFQVLQNNKYGLVGVSSISEIEPNQTSPTVGPMTIIIGKQTKEFWLTSAIVGQPAALNEPVHGTCINK